MIKELIQNAENSFYKSQYQSAIDQLKKASLIAEEKKEWEYYVEIQNNLGVIFDYLSKYQEALTHLSKAQKIGNNYLPSNSPKVAETFNAMGLVYAHENRYEECEKYFAQATIILQQLPSQKRELANIYNNQGWFLSNIGKYEQSLKYHHSALGIRLTAIEERPEEVAQSYNNIGACYIYTGDTNTALSYYHKALNTWHSMYGDKHPKTAIAYNNIGWAYSQQTDFKKALRYYKKALQIRQEIFDKPHVFIAHSLENIAYCLTELNQFNEALTEYQKAITIRTTLVAKNHPTLVKTYRNIGRCYLEMKQYGTALQYLDQALQIHQQTPNQHVEKVIIHITYGQYYERTQQHQKAIKAFHQVLTTAIPSYQTEDVYQIPVLDKYYHAIKLGYALNHKAKAFLNIYLQSQNTKDLTVAKKHYAKAIQVLNDNRRNYKTTDSKLNHAKLVVGTYEWAIYAAYLSYQSTQNLEDFHTAFSFAELSKSYVLFSKLKEAEAKISAHIPAEILQKEQSLQTEIASLDKRIQQLQLKTNNQHSKAEQNEMIRYLQDKHFDISLQYEQVIKEIEKDYPQYFQLKYDLQTAHPTHIQAQLSPNKTLINYFVGSEKLFVFAISKEQFHFLHLLKSDELANTIEYVHDAIGMGDEDDLQDLGEQLFEQLLAPILSKEPHCKELVFIPDDCLHRLPFDILWGDKPPKTTEKQPEKSYLIQNYQISYHYSATLWSESQKKSTKKANQTNSFLGIAPVNFENVENTIEVLTPIKSPEDKDNIIFKSDFNSDGKLKELTDSKDEIQYIAKLFEQQELPSTVLLYQQATKENFLHHLKEKKYIVLSSHGFYNEENPSLSGIYFAKKPKTASHNRSPLTIEENKLYISDTFHLPLDVDLVVLSSCESGIGELQKGEGMLALNRGFLYAGASNIIYSLFKVPDAASQLTPSFFRYVLQENCSYAEALQKAKINLIEAGQEPLYWAGFALVGR